MSHYTEGVLQAYLDNEVASDTRAAVAAHVSGCGACAGRLQELRDLAHAFADALRVSEVGVPAVAFAELRVRAEQSNWRDRFARSRTALLRAAGFVLAVTAVAAAAVPGSPVREWLAGVFSPDPVAEQAAPAPAPVEPSVADQNGRIEPVAGKVKVVLQNAAEGSIVHVDVIDDDEKASISGTWQSMRTQAGQMTVVGGSGKLQILLPSSVRNATVEVNGRVFVTKSGDELKFMGPKANLVGPDLTFRAR